MLMAASFSEHGGGCPPFWVSLLTLIAVWPWACRGLDDRSSVSGDEDFIRSHRSNN